MTTPSITRTLRVVADVLSDVWRKVTRSTAEACDATHPRGHRRARFDDVQDTVCGCWRLCADHRDTHESWCIDCLDEIDAHEDRRDMAAERCDEVA